ncbi:hypothetical protein Peur_012959 [Populus x canadensis]
MQQDCVVKRNPIPLPSAGLCEAPHKQNRLKLLRHCNLRILENSSRLVYILQLSFHPHATLIPSAAKEPTLPMSPPRQT